MDQIPLKAQKRSVLGRKVKTLRKEGIIPAHVFGKKVKTEHIQVVQGEFTKVFEKSGETGIIDLTIDSKKKPVLVKNVQYHPVSDDLLHIDFYQVNLSEKVKVDVPLEIVGEAPAAHKKIGLLLTPVSELEIEALPTDLPENIEVNVEDLDEVGKEIKVKDLKIDRSKVEIHADDELVVAQIGEMVTKEMEAAEAEIEAEQAETATEGAEEAQVEGEEKKAEGAEEGKDEKQAEGSDKKEDKPQDKPTDDKKD